MLSIFTLPLFLYWKNTTLGYREVCRSLLCGTSRNPSEQKPTTLSSPKKPEYCREKGLAQGSQQGEA